MCAAMRFRRPSFFTPLGLVALLCAIVFTAAVCLAWIFG